MPIYEQIKDQIRTSIIADVIREGQMLPSIRTLASELKVSVITTMRAYNELEQEGYIATMQGKGCFVLPKNKEYIKEQKLQEIETLFADAITASKVADISEKELKEILEILLNNV